MSNHVLPTDGKIEAHNIEVIFQEPQKKLKISFSCDASAPLPAWPDTWPSTVIPTFQTTGDIHETHPCDTQKEN